MTAMLANATSFNQPLSSWDVSGVASMYAVFKSASSFNQDLSSWDVSNVTSWSEMFRGAAAFNGSTAGWQMHGSLNELSFALATDFTGIGLDTWDTSGITNLRKGFFGGPVFNPDISDWDVSNVTNMNQTFVSCPSFDQDLSGWDINQVTNFTSFMSGSTALSTANYDALLIAWDAQGAMSFSGTVKFGGSKYTAGGAAATARASLVTKWGAITDGGTA